MARPPKKGLDYFPLDIDVFSNRKIKIVTARYGADGFTVYIYLLCQIFKNGYYIEVDEDFDYVVSSELNMSYEKIRQIRNFLLERSLFDNTLFKSDKVLTSAEIQDRYQFAVRGRKTDIPVDGRFWLLNEEETKAFIKVRKNHHFSEKNYDYSEKNLDNSKNYTTKKSKVKKSKVKESVDSDGVTAEIAHAVSSHSLNYEKIMEQFNTICKSRPKAPALTDKTRRNIELAGEKIKGDFEGLFRRVESSEFLSGRNGRWNGCDFDWIFNPQNLMKILNGQYDDKKEEQNGRRSSFSDEDLEFIKSLGTNL